MDHKLITDTSEGRKGSVETPPLKLDVERYQSYLDQFDISAEQKATLLEVLWNIMRSFVDLGFGEDSIHYIVKGVLEENPKLSESAMELNSGENNTGEELRKEQDDE